MLGGRWSGCRAQTGSHGYTSRVRSSGVKLFFTAGSQCSASFSGVQPSGARHDADRPRLVVQIHLVAAHAEDLPRHARRRIGAQERDQLRDVIRPRPLGARLQLLLGLAGHRLDHAAERVRADAVGADVVALHVHRDAARQPGDAQFRRAVVHLPDAADQPRGGGDMHVAAALLLAEMRHRGAADIEGAVQMHLHHRVPFLGRHVVEHAVAQDAGVVHHHVDAAEIVDRGLHDLLRVLPLGDAVGVRHRAALAVRLGDLGHHLLRRADIVALAGHRGADVVHHDLGAVRRQADRGRAADAAPRAGHDGDLAVQHSSHSLLSHRQQWPNNAPGGGVCHPTGVGPGAGLGLARWGRDAERRKAAYARLQC